MRPGEFLRSRARRAATALECRFAGHLSVGPLTIYGFNAMHGAMNLKTPLGYVCLKLPSPDRGWYFYVSVNATPWAA